ncbi:MAG TPA: tellurite resistance TerB family protein [Rhizomicrobium sp.]
MNTISHHAALIYVMVVVSASDGAMTDRELHAIGELVKTLPVFREFDSTRLIAVSQECAAILEEPDGLDAVLGLVREALTPSLRETAYVLGLDIALVDARVRLEELRVLDILRRALDLDRLVAVSLERAAQARFQSG